MKGFGNTDIGKNRNSNEDNIFVCNEKIGEFENLYIVADGIGGHNAGDIASQKSIEFFVDSIKEGKIEDDDVLDLMISSASYANYEIYEMARLNKEYENMGTTFLATTIKNNKIYIIHIGDCRLYGIRDDKIVRMTTDHTYAMDLFKAGVISKEEAEVAKEASVLTRALGTNKNIEADALFCDIFPEDIFIMCSDGLNTMVSDEDIKSIALDKSLSPEQKVEKMIDKANQNGGKDNIAIIIIE